MLQVDVVTAKVFFAWRLALVVIARNPVELVPIARRTIHVPFLILWSFSRKAEQLAVRLLADRTKHFIRHALWFVGSDRREHAAGVRGLFLHGTNLVSETSAEV